MSSVTSTGMCLWPLWTPKVRPTNCADRRSCRNSSASPLVSTTASSTFHVLRHEHWNVLVAVVDTKGEADELRQDRRSARPGFDDILATGSARRFRLFEQIAVDKRTFPDRTSHDDYPCVFPWRDRTMNFVVRLFLRVRAPFVGLPHGVTGWRPPLVRPSPPPCGWSMGFIAVPRTCGRLPFHTLRPALPMTSFMWSGFETAPTVAMHSSCTRRTSPELSRSIA